jgi:hypothetical protein
MCRSASDPLLRKGATPTLQLLVLDTGEVYISGWLPSRQPCAGLVLAPAPLPAVVNAVQIGRSMYARLRSTGVRSNLVSGNQVYWLG